MKNIVIINAQSTDLGRRITPLAFERRFTTEEAMRIDLRSIDDPAAAQAVREISAQLRVMQRRSAQASFIDLADPDTRAAVEALEALGIIAAGRAAEILDAAVTAVELPG